MRDWEERVRNAGASVVGEEGIIVNGAPDEEAEEKCKELGRAPGCCGFIRQVKINQSN